MADWYEQAIERRGRRARERQLEYQKAKAVSFRESTHELAAKNFLRSQALRKRLSVHSPIEQHARVLEVGSGPHGLIFGFEACFGVGIDPLAVDYKRLFPDQQERAFTAAAIGEELPFADGAFDVVLSDNVIDHATRPLAIVDELVRVLKPGGLLYFTVNIHHPIYELVSKAHGAWNELGIKLELSAFADHTVHFTDRRIKSHFNTLPIEVVEQHSMFDLERPGAEQASIQNARDIPKKLFFKNGLFELIARRI